MPAASTKSENKTSSEVIDAMKQVVNLLDKKVRNLEKRKSKLDSYKAKADNGATLEKDQEEAIAHYEEVIQNLEFAKDLQKQIITISVDSEKVTKKQAKRDKMERQMMETRRFRELLQLQSMLDNLGSDSVRNDFKTGKHGAVVLTEENLTQLDELYKLISPSREGDVEFGEQLNQAAEHIISLLDSKDKEVVGTTYKELKELMDLINGCGYFENMPSYEQEETQLETNPVETPSAEHAEYEEPIVEPIVDEPQPVISAVSTNEPISQQYSQPIEQDVLQADDIQQSDDLEQDTYYAVTSAAYRQRPFQEIVSSVQGSFNFLQESTIDIESPHMDPAVVAMAPAPIPHPVTGGQADPSGGLSQQSYAAQALLSDHHSQSSRGQQASSDSHEQSAGLVGDYNNQSYNKQNALSSQAGVYQMDDTTSTHQTPHQSPNILSQSTSAGLGDPSVTNMMPAHIPIPNQSNLSQDDEDLSNQSEKKPFTMNANAAVFQSMYSSQGSGGQSGTEKSQQQQQTSQSSYTDYQSNYQGGLQNNNNSSYQRSGSGGSRGGFRGGRGRGGMANGYPPRGGSRGGSMNGGRGGCGGMTNGCPPRRGSRGGSMNGGRGGCGGMTNGYPPRRGSRGGSMNGGRGSYQGYPARNDYRPEGYQGYSNNNTGYYSKRGGGGGPPRGSSRGGGPRGGSGGRGGPRSGGFGRPVNMNSQTAMSQ